MIGPFWLHIPNIPLYLFFKKYIFDSQKKKKKDEILGKFWPSYTSTFLKQQEKMEVGTKEIS